MVALVKDFIYQQPCLEPAATLGLAVDRKGWDAFAQLCDQVPDQFLRAAGKVRLLDMGLDEDAQQLAARQLSGQQPQLRQLQDGGAFKSTPAYAVVDLFAGLTGNEGGWDLGVYAKNVFDKQAELARVFTPNTIFPLFAAPSGYDVVRTSPPAKSV